MKIKQLSNNVYEVDDHRGHLTVANDLVISLIDKQGVLHLPFNTPDEEIKSESAVYDLDQEMGSPTPIFFDIHKCLSLGRHFWDHCFVKTNIDNYYIYTDHGNFTDHQVRFSLAPGVTTKGLLIAVIHALYPLGMYTTREAFRLVKNDHFPRDNWSTLTQADILNIYMSYELDSIGFDYNHFETVKPKFTTLKENHPLHGIVQVNYDKCEVVSKGDEKHYVILFHDCISDFDNYSECDVLLNELFNEVPYHGVLMIGDKGYDVVDYIGDFYEWDPGLFLTNLFETHSFNKSVRKLITDKVTSHKNIEHLDH